MWNCPVCGSENQGNFCGECGRAKSGDAQETIRIKKVETANFDGGVTVKYKVDSQPIMEKNQEKKKINKAVVAVSIAVGVIVISVICLFGYYLGAGADMRSGNYDVAAKKYRTIGFFGNSSEMADKAIFEKGKMLFDAGSFREAKKEFESIENFDGVAEMMFKCEVELLLQYKDTGDFESAAELVAQMPESRKSGKDEIKQIEIWCNYAHAESILEKEPEKARELLEKIDPEYENTKQLILECTYLLAKSYEADGEFDKAKKEFKNCIGYKDSQLLLNSVDTSILASAVKAYDTGDYEKCKSLIEQCENLNEDDLKKADAYKLFLSYKTDIYQRPAVNSRLFSYLGLYTDARKIVLEDSSVMADFMEGSWQENGIAVFSVSNNFNVSNSIFSFMPDGVYSYNGDSLIINSAKVVYDIEIINESKIKVYFADNSGEHILLRF